MSILVFIYSFCDCFSPFPGIMGYLQENKYLDYDCQDYCNQCRGLGVLKLYLRNVPPGVWNPYPFLRISLPQNMANLTLFLKFLPIRTHCYDFSASETADFTIFPRNFGQMGPSSKDFLAFLNISHKHYRNREKICGLSNNWLLANNWFFVK